MMRAEDLIIEDAVSPNILKKLRGGAERLGRVMRSSYADIGSMQAPHGYRSPYWNFITVAKQGGDFQTITEALIAIEGNSDINRYCIFVYPGAYDEQVVMKPYVALVGTDRDVCIIQSADYQSLVTMASHSSLNEIQVVNGYDTNTAAIYGNGIDDVLIDSCIARVFGYYGDALAAWFEDCDQIRLSGSEFFGYNPNLGTIVILLSSLNRSPSYNEIKRCRAVVEDGTAGHSRGISLNANGAYLAEFKVLGCLVDVENATARHDGIRVVSFAGGDCKGYIEHTSINRRSTAGGGYDFDVEKAAAGNPIAYVRADRYANWKLDSGLGGLGQILPLAGDRPRLECAEQAAPFDITAGAGVWQNTNCSTTINLPCKSGLKVVCFIRWRNNTNARTLSTGFQIDLDGVSQAGRTTYLSADVIGNWNATTVVACFSNVPTGVHTITVQALRDDAGDAIRLVPQNLSVESVPWP